METIERHVEPCSICNDVYTAAHTEIEPGVNIYVCEDCVEAARYNFIWLCLHCGRAFLRPKNTAAGKMEEKFIFSDENKVIQTINMCHKCDPNGTERYMKLEVVNMEC